MPNLNRLWETQGAVGLGILFYFASPSPILAQIPTYPAQEALPSANIRSSPSLTPNVNLSDYFLGTGDRVDINVIGYEEFTNLERVVLPDGTITLPLLGSVRAAGKTAEGLQAELSVRLNEYLVEPFVTVSISILRPVVVNVAGEVQRPGPVQLNSITTNIGRLDLSERDRRLPTVSAALIAAGGVTRKADLRQVVLRRFTGRNNAVVTDINLWDALISETPPEDLILQDGDSIFVPRLGVDSDINPKLLSRSSLAPDTVNVRVVGEVRAPGEVKISPDSSLSSAVAAAGGPTDDAELNSVTFVRINEEGFIENQDVDLSSLTDNLQVQEGDVIFVPKTNLTTGLDAAERLGGPIRTVINILDFIF
ncbi:MAG: polysaccharide biosynthesis/export family protein [Spirulinaceae cyanobacterium]